MYKHHQFAVGDKVRCVQEDFLDKGVFPLKGGIYTVKSLSNEIPTLTLEEMPQNWDEKRFEKVHVSDFAIINVTVDVVCFAYHEGGLKVLVITRGNEPFKGQHALPGGFLEPNETAQQGALRELFEETGVTGNLAYVLNPRTEPGRDPRGATVSLPFVATTLEPQHACAQDDAATVEWMDVTEVTHKSLTGDFWAFDHEVIFAQALSKFSVGDLYFETQKKAGV